MDPVRGGGAEARLKRAMLVSAAAAGCELTVTACRSHPWSSATYVGEQLSFALALAPAHAARVWLEALCEAELPMRGYVAMPPAIDRLEQDGDALRVDLSVLVLLDG